jgi:hypothetical protein
VHYSEATNAGAGTDGNGGIYPFSSINVIPVGDKRKRCVLGTFLPLTTRWSNWLIRLCGILSILKMPTGHKNCWKTTAHERDIVVFDGKPCVE